MGLGAWSRPFRSLGPINRHLGDRVIHERKVIEALNVIVGGVPSEVYHRGYISPNATAAWMVGLQKIIGILRSEPLRLHSCSCRGPCRPCLWGQSVVVEDLPQSLTATPGDGVAYMFAWVVYIRSLEGCILIHELYIRHGTNVWVSYFKEFQCFSLRVETPVVVEGDALVQFSDASVIIMAIENSSKADATLRVEEGMFAGVRRSKEFGDAGWGCSRSLPKISLLLLPSYAR